MIKGEIKLRVRYSDTDQMGYVYYGRYASFYEVARVELFRNLGFSYKKLDEEGVGMPVIVLESKYILPFYCLFNQLLINQRFLLRKISYFTILKWKV